MYSREIDIVSPSFPCQLDRFIETAKALECDEDEARFKEKLGKIAKAKVPNGPTVGLGL
jgi:hypothetical protein